MAEGGNLRAGIYERVSVKLTGKEARSVAQQNAANLAACEKHGWTVAGHYADPGISASRYARNKRREEYERMRADVAAGLLDVLVFYRINRADRKLPELAGLLEECRDRGMLIYITLGGGHLYDVRNGPDWHQLAIAAVAAAADSDQISADVKRGMQDNLREGKPHGPTPYGFTRLYDEFRNITGQEPDPETAPVRREIITRVAAGEALTAIGSDLERRGVATPRGGQWSASSIRSLVLSPVNVARRRYDPEHAGAGITTPGAEWWKPLIDEGTWQAACGRLDASRRGSPRPGAPSHRYLLSYLAVCGVCGGKMGVRSGRWSVPAYCCWKRGCTGIRHDWLDAYVMGRVCALLNAAAFWDALLNGEDDASREARAREAELRQRLRKLRSLTAAGRITEESFAEMEADLMPLITRASQRAARAAASPHLTAIGRQKDAAAVRDILESRPVPVRKEIIRTLYSKIEVMPASSKGRQSGFDRQRVKMTRRGQSDTLPRHAEQPPDGIG